MVCPAKMLGIASRMDLRDGRLSPELWGSRRFASGRRAIFLRVSVAQTLLPVLPGIARQKPHGQECPCHLEPSFCVPLLWGADRLFCWGCGENKAELCGAEFRLFWRKFPAARCAPEHRHIRRFPRPQCSHECRCHSDCNVDSVFKEHPVSSRDRSGRFRPGRGEKTAPTHANPFRTRCLLWKLRRSISPTSRRNYAIAVVGAR
jgi:hypothetical protein